jgi:hypothetical protein
MLSAMGRKVESLFKYCCVLTEAAVAAAALFLGCSSTEGSPDAGTECGDMAVGHCGCTESSDCECGLVCARHVACSVPNGNACVRR